MVYMHNHLFSQFLSPVCVCGGITLLSSCVQAPPIAFFFLTSKANTLKVTHEDANTDKYYLLKCHDVCQHLKGLALTRSPTGDNLCQNIV